MDLTQRPRHVVAIIGGAVAGSEAAALCAERGILTLVIEQNARPYGKIEDGLPRWHTALRQQEYAKIDENLSHPNVLFVPKTRLGRDWKFEDVTREWGLSATVLASGAWRDRPFGIPGIERFVDRGLVYQNSLVYWYNHYPEAGYDGPRYEIVDDAIVVGGGLASIDVVKIIQLELYERAMRARGIETDMHELERHGIGTALAKHKIDPAQLGIRGCTLFYRRRKKDMPLASPPDDATPEQLKKIETVREKVMDVCIKKYLVRFEELHVPIEPIAEGDRMVGLKFRRTEMKDGKLVEIPGSEREVRGPMTVSSIGSIPEPLPGIPMRGELYPWASWDTGELADAVGVYGLGNVLTGKGNIKVSRQNAKEVTEAMLASYLGLTGDETGAEKMYDQAHDEVREAARPIADAVMRKPALAADRVAAIVERVKQRWSEVGYGGDYAAWKAKVTPAGFV